VENTVHSTAKNIGVVGQMICSQEHQPCTHKSSSREIVRAPGFAA